MSISFEMDLTKYFIERKVYTILDVLRDIGGLSGMLFILGRLIVILLSGNGLTYSLMTNMFKEEGVQDSNYK